MAKNMRNFGGFTLAEVMIVLTVIGVLTAILLPVARQSMPDKNLMKFKKAHNTLGTVIRELVTSDKYYLNGDLGKKPDNTFVEDTNYFCTTISEVVNTKSVNCKNPTIAMPTALIHVVAADWYKNGTISIPPEKHVDKVCKENLGNESTITLNDDVVIYELTPSFPFGQQIEKNSYATSYYWEWNGKDPNSADANYEQGKGFYYIYKTVCIDIDKIGSGEDPFGYGIRVDGKILVGARAQEWLERDVNED